MSQAVVACPGFTEDFHLRTACSRFNRIEADCQKKITPLPLRTLVEFISGDGGPANRSVRPDAAAGVSFLCNELDSPYSITISPQINSFISDGTSPCRRSPGRSGRRSAHQAVSPDGTFALVSNLLGNNVGRIDAAARAQQAPACMAPGCKPRKFGMSPSGIFASSAGLRSAANALTSLLGSEDATPASNGWWRRRGGPTRTR